MKKPINPLKVERNEFAASDEFPYTATLEGIKLIGLGGSEKDAYEDLVNEINTIIKLRDDIVKRVGRHTDPMRVSV